MLNLQISLLNILVDSQNDSMEELIQKIEAEIAKSKPYDHTDKGMMQPTCHHYVHFLKQ